MSDDDFYPEPPKPTPYSETVRTTQITAETLMLQVDPNFNAPDRPVTYVFGGGRRAFRQRNSNPYG